MDAAVKFPTTPHAAKAAPCKLSKRASVEQAFQAIVRSCIDQIQANEAGVVRFNDMESLHQMRVGLRRLRAALAMFDAVLEAPAEISSDLVWIMDQLAPARDWGVLLGTTLPQVERALAEEASLGRLRMTAQNKLSPISALAASALGTSRYQHLIKELSDWIETRAWRDELAPKRRDRLKLPAVDLARTVLASERRRLIKRGRALKTADDAQRHRVRIAAKRTRYAVEFFASLFSGRVVRPYLAALSGLQSELGAMNDGAVARRLLDDLCADDVALREARCLVLGYLTAAQEARGKHLGRRWERLISVKQPA